MTTLEKLLMKRAAVIVAFLFAYGMGKRYGKREEKVKNQQRTLTMVCDKNRIATDIAGISQDKLHYWN